MRIVALLAVRNEERFVGGCIEHLARHGIETYLIDNDSSDDTVGVARSYRDDGLLDIERLPFAGTYAWRRILERKEDLAASLAADWFLHVDADEIRLPPAGVGTLAEAVREVDRHGYNAVDFAEFTFVPTLEHPDHDHPRYLETMRAYYAFAPSSPARLNLWKGQPRRVDLASGAGHRVTFPGLRMYPEPFRMRHYLFLSVEHARRKYVERSYDPAELAAGWHRRRAELLPEEIGLQSERELRTFVSDELLDASDPRTSHPLFEGRR